MAREKSNPEHATNESRFADSRLYGRVARQLKVDPSYVSRVARGERQSDEIEASLERELKRIMGWSAGIITALAGAPPNLRAPAHGKRRRSKSARETEFSPV